MDKDLGALLSKVSEATGADRKLDRRIARELDAAEPGVAVPDYTASVDHCIGLVDRVLPGWRWRVGYGPIGIRVYAFVDSGETWYEAMAPTVPLALLGAIIKAKASGEKRNKR